MDHAIGIDIGTTNTKVGLFEYPAARLLRMESFPTPQYRIGAGGDFSVVGILRGIQEAVRSVAGDCGKSVRVISIASVGESGVLVGRFGAYSSTAHLWYDQHGHEHVEKIWADGRAEEYFKVTGLVPHPNHSLGHILYQRDLRASLEVSTWMPIADFVAWKITRERGTDESLASRTLCLDILGGTMSERILSEHYIPASLFPPLAESGSTRGTVDRSMARSLGVAAGCEVCVAGHDHMVGSVAAGLSGPGQALNSTGTSEGVLMLGTKPDLSHEAFLAQLSNGRYVLPGLFSRYASHSAAGLSFEWASGIMGMTPDELFARADALLKRYMAKGPTQGRELFVPHLRGSGPPLRDPSARGSFVGLSSTTTQDDLIMAVYLGVCMELRRVFECAGASGAREMRVIGPATRSPLWMQLKADALGVRALACDVREAVATGAVALAAIKRGEKPQVGDVAAVYEPDRTRHEALDELFCTRYLPLVQQ